MCGLQCVHFHSFSSIEGLTISSRCTGTDSLAGNGRTSRLSLSRTLTYSSVSLSTELLKVSTIDPVVITMPRRAASSHFVFGHVRRRGYVRHMMKRGEVCIYSYSRTSLDSNYRIMES